ncbi:MAG: hypothetical protein C0596_02105 [Marinilabiliales bacterium]|nr:MAG: hypothetical protein C0596_02105 [Marinilabiliales bacterium]
MLFTPVKLKSQYLSFFNDYLDNVEVFDEGNIKQIEHLPLKTYQVTNTLIAYEDNAGNFKVYHNNYLHKVSNFVSDYTASDHLIGFNMNTQLKVFDNGDVKNLSLTMKEYFVSDEVIVWYDDFEKMLKVYYDRDIFDLDDALATDTMNAVMLGENTVAFVDSKNYMNIFYYGYIDQVCYADRVKSIEPGRDIVAFVEEPVDNFQVYYFGEFIELETFEPVSYKTGDGFVAYIDANNYLKVFTNYKTHTISFDVPDFYEVVDQLMVFGVQDYFKVFYNGNVYTLESYIPDEYQINNNVLGYIDQMGNLKFFDGEKTTTISYESISSFNVHGSLIKYKFGVNSEHIYFSDKTYKND